MVKAVNFIHVLAVGPKALIDNANVDIVNGTLVSFKTDGELNINASADTITGADLLAARFAGGNPDFSAGAQVQDARGTGLTRYGAGALPKSMVFITQDQNGDAKKIYGIASMPQQAFEKTSVGTDLPVAFELWDNLSQMLYVIDGDSKGVVITDAWIRSSSTQLTQDAGEDLQDGFAFGEQRILAQYQGSASTGQVVFLPLQGLYASDLPLLHVRRLIDLNKEAKLQLGLRDINTRDANQIANLSSSQGLYVSAFPQLQAIAPDGAIIAQLFSDRDISDAGDDVTFNAALASAQWSGDQIFSFTNEATGGKVTSPADLIGFNAFMRAEPLYVVSAGTEVLFYQHKLFLQDN